MWQEEWDNGKGDMGVFFFFCVLVQTYTLCNTQYIITIYTSVPNITP